MRLVFALAALLFAMPAEAHSLSPRFGEIYSGLLHPITTLGHLVPWIAMGLVSVAAPKPLGKWVIVIFPAAVFLGSVLATLLSIAPSVAFVNLASFVVLGGLTLWSKPLSAAVFIGLTFVFGLTHGYANNDALLTGWPLLRFGLGLVLSAYFVMTLGAALSAYLIQRGQWGQIAVRAAGSWIVAIGIVFAGFQTLAA